MATNILNAAESELLVSVFGEAATGSFTLSQMRALGKLVQNCPNEMAEAVAELDDKLLAETLRHYGLSIGRGSSTSWRTLLSAVSDVLPSIYQLSKEDSTTLLNGLCKSIRSQVVSIPLFLALLSAWKKNALVNADQGGVGAGAPSPGLVSPGRKQKEELEKKEMEDRFNEISSTLNLSISELMYIFDLIRERLSVELTRISAMGNSITVTDFELLLRKSRTVIDPNKLDRLIAGLMSTSVGAPGVPVPSYGDRYEIVDRSGNLNAKNLLDFTVFVEQGHIFQLPGYRTMKERVLQTRISTHLLRAVKKSWPVAFARFVAAGTTRITATAFEKMIREGGTLLSADDMERIWEAVSLGVGIGSFDGMNAEVSLAELDGFMQGFVEVDTDPKSFVMMELMDKGEREHHFRRIPEGPHQAFNHKIDLTWATDGPDRGGGDVRLGAVSPRKKHFERKQVSSERSTGLPWEEKYTEAGHEQSQIEAQLRLKSERAQRHHYSDGDVDVALPWMDQFNNEGTASTNLQRRITLRVHSLSPGQFQTFVSALKRHSHTQFLNAQRQVAAGRALAPEDHVDFTSATGKEVISRVTLRESLAEAGIFVSPSDSSDLFLNVARHCAGFNMRVKAGSGIDTPVNITEVFKWMRGAHGVGNSGKEVYTRYMALVGLSDEGPTGDGESVLAPGGSEDDKTVGGDAFLAAFAKQGVRDHNIEGAENDDTATSLHMSSKTHFNNDNNNNNESKPPARDHQEHRHVAAPGSYLSVPMDVVEPARRVNASELRGAGASNPDVPPSPPPPPSPTKSGFIFGTDEGTAGKPLPHHLRANSIFANPMYAQEGLGERKERVRVSRAPPSRNIFGAVGSDEEGAMGAGGNDQWPKPMPSWQQAAAERARGGGNSASRIFGVEEEQEVLVPPPPPLSSSAIASATAAKQNAGTLTGAAGTVVGTEDVIAVLQTKRANLALVFRRLAAMSDHSSGLVKLHDFGKALPDLVSGNVGALLKVQPDVCWQAVCDIAGRPYTSDPNASSNVIHYNDVVRFLDKAQRDAENGLNGAQIMRSLKDKCFRSRDLAGDKLKLITLTPQLRQRQKQRVLTNRSRSKGVTGASNSYEFVNAHDLIDLFASIDLHISTSEARWLCDQSATGDDKIGMLEPTTRLSSVVQWISQNLLA